MAGRPTLYSDELAEIILDRLAEGYSMVDVCKDDAMPGLRTVMRWAAENEKFGTRYAHAREAQAEVMDDKILKTAEGAGTDPQGARVKIDAYKWRASKLAPRRYGDKIDVTSGGESLREVDDTTRAIRIASVLNTLKNSDADQPG